MKHSVAGGAAAILEKSRSRMRGQHFTLGGRGTSKKTEQPKQPSKNTEDDDIAAYLSLLSKKTSGKKNNSDDISAGMSDLSLSDEAKNSTSLKFMKKSSTASAVLPTCSSSQSAHSIQQSARPMSGKMSTSFTSSALQRASKYNAKIASRKIIVDSDSSEDRSDQYQELDVTVNTFSPPVSENRDKYRFMKKPLSKTEPISNGESKQENPSSFATQLESYPHVASNATESKMKAELSTKAKSGSATMPLTSTPIRNTQQSSSSSRRNVYSKIMAELDSDEESIDYLIGDIVESSSFVKDVQQASPRRLSDTGDLLENTKHISVDESSVQSTIGEDVGLTFFGLQTIDDLLPPSTLHTRDSSSHHDISHHRDIESIRTTSPLMDSIASIHGTPKSSMPSADSYSSVASYSSRSSLSRSDSNSSLSTSNNTRSKISESSINTITPSRSVTSINTITPSRSVSYSHDFDTLSHSDDTTVSDDQTIASDFSTSHSESNSRSSQPSNVSKRIGHDAAVQTSGSLHSINHHWLKDYDFQTPGYFKLLSANINDTVSHYVDPMVLQTLSSFDSTSLVLHANLVEQVRQTQLAVTNTMRQHQTFLDSLQEDYCYTTLENTKAFIKRQKKRRRRRNKDQSETPLEVGDMTLTL